MITKIYFQKLLELECPKSVLFQTKNIALIKLKNDIVSAKNDPIPIRDAFAGLVSDQDIDKYVKEWQKIHGEGIKVLKKCNYVLFFVPEKKNQARFVATYIINGSVEKSQTVEFDMCRMTDFSSLEGRLVVSWIGDRRVYQYWTRGNKGDKLNDKYVILIDDGLKRNNQKFISYQDVVLSYDDLCHVVEDKEWINKLSAVNCIYSIVDKQTGRQYIGQTANKLGILGRWREYAKTGHGGDVELIKLLEQDCYYAKKYFQWTILETLPPVNENDKDGKAKITEREQFYKRKFCTNVKNGGYNPN